MQLYLGIETSCDDTSCAIYSPEESIVAYKTASQLDHAKYGGVVPEIASRTHMKTLLPLYETVMEEAGIGLGDLAGIGVTNGPGLTGSLLVGLSFAKAIAYGSGIPLAGIHHIEGHILANAIEEPMENIYKPFYTLHINDPIRRRLQTSNGDPPRDKGYPRSN